MKLFYFLSAASLLAVSNISADQYYSLPNSSYGQGYTSNQQLNSPSYIDENSQLDLGRGYSQQGLESSQEIPAYGSQGLNQGQTFSSQPSNYSQGYIQSESYPQSQPRGYSSQRFSQPRGYSQGYIQSESYSQSYSQPRGYSQGYIQSETYPQSYGSRGYSSQRYSQPRGYSSYSYSQPSSYSSYSYSQPSAYSSQGNSYCPYAQQGSNFNQQQPNQYSQQGSSQYSQQDQSYSQYNQQQDQTLNQYDQQDQSRQNFSQYNQSSQDTRSSQSQLNQNNRDQDQNLRNQDQQNQDQNSRQYNQSNQNNSLNNQNNQNSRLNQNNSQNRDYQNESSFGGDTAVLKDQFKTDSDRKLGDALRKVLADNNVDTSKIFLSIDNGNVVVKGKVSNNQEKDRIQHLLQDQANVKTLDNKIEVKTGDATAYRNNNGKRNPGPHADFHPGFTRHSPNL